MHPCEYIYRRWGWGSRTVLDQESCSPTQMWGESIPSSKLHPTAITSMAVCGPGTAKEDDPYCRQLGFCLVFVSLPKSLFAVLGAVCPTGTLQQASELLPKGTIAISFAQTSILCQSLPKLSDYDHQPHFRLQTRQLPNK